ncbi:hypothetical protein QJS10_CPA01g02685 [Acorus calamus]|uniref:Uncharacterized protein n=1 Tax=Acorus calamus TaxID=4465 RepID=A0AAV9FH06_ACOCL|nr:hypothetical protein QJS10_CPA01g02685 [Acorus calamus]
MAPEKRSQGSEACSSDHKMQELWSIEAATLLLLSCWSGARGSSSSGKNDSTS